jgi:steroid 5-alpha reductase family enzyme
MSTLTLWLSALPVMLGLSLIVWALATARRNAGLVDIFWSIFFLVGTIVYAAGAAPLGTRAVLVLALVVAWSLRLSIYLAARNWNAPEDHRYRAIRERNQPGFMWKSIYLVFGLQAALAWLISAPLGASMSSMHAINALDALGVALAMFGIGFETLADKQLARFKADPANAGKVMDRGLWRYTRHPNYFGEFCVWWGLFLIALGAQAWWTLFSPLLMTLLLLKVSGVALLEKDIGERRPAYRDYAARTNAFFPGPARKKTHAQTNDSYENHTHS